MSENVRDSGHPRYRGTSGPKRHDRFGHKAPGHRICPQGLEVRCNGETPYHIHRRGDSVCVYRGPAKRGGEGHPGHAQHAEPASDGGFGARQGQSRHGRGHEKGAGRLRSRRQRFGSEGTVDGRDHCAERRGACVRLSFRRIAHRSRSPAGHPRPQSRTLALQTIRGAAEMLVATGEHPVVLRENVSSPGGTTLAALAELERGAFTSLILEAVKAATERSKELGKALS